MQTSGHKPFSFVPSPPSGSARAPSEALDTIRLSIAIEKSCPPNRLSPAAATTYRAWPEKRVGWPREAGDCWQAHRRTGPNGESGDVKSPAHAGILTH
eukprot:scaffold4302_cov98-Isochrysis_galbana.AAC.2